jgi:PAS domain S-box-containing protein
MGFQPAKRGSDQGAQPPGPPRPGVSGFLRAHKDAILRLWETRVTSEQREIALTGLALRDDLPELLDDLSAWLASDGAPETSLVAACALTHVRQRLEQGLSLAQVFREYRLLRETIIETVLGAEAAEQLRAGVSGEASRVARVTELARLNAGLDVVLSQSIEQFVEERDRRATLERASAAQSLSESETRYRSLFESIDEGFCIIEMIFDGERPVDYRFLLINPAFERHTGLEDATGKRIREMVPAHDQHWFETYGRVAKTGEPARFENVARALGRVFDVFAFRVGAPEQHQVAVLFNDITERKRAEKALQEANDRLVEVDRRKNEFLAVLSHELRNPLAPILNSVYILERAPAGGDQAIRARQVIDRQAQHMARLIEDLLDVTRISRGKIVLQRERLDVNAIARRTAEDHHEVFARNGVHLEIVTGGKPIWVDGDRTRLAQVIGNLLINAAKFTPRGGKTVLAVEESARHGVIRVRDNGAGMSSATLEHIFEPFVQAAQTIERTRGGLGLGLALVKGLVELHDGTVTARSEGEGKGSELVVTLPLQSPSASTLDGGAGAVSQPSARRVLVIEDNPDSADSLREALELGGHEVTVKYSGSEGLAAARANTPDVIICDIGLPGLDGHEVARAIRADANARLRQTFLIALSGYALPEDLTKSKQAGFDRHIAKPPSIEALEAVLEEACPSHGVGADRRSDQST